jgi:hypothetical protein
MTIDKPINAIASVEVRTIVRYQATTSNDVASFDIARADLHRNESDEDHYWRIRSGRAPQTVADCFAPPLNC